MADILAGYRTYLLTQSAVTTLASTRVYFGHLPQNATLEAITLNLVGGNIWGHLGGSSDVMQQTVQVDCFGNTQTEAVALADAVRKATDYYSGTMGSVTVQNATIGSYMRNGFHPYGDGGTAHQHFVGFDVSITHAIASPTT